MLTFSYPATFRKDAAGRILVRFPDFPRSATDGADLTEAMSEAIDCLGSRIAFLLAHKQEVPKPAAIKRGQKLVPVPLWIAPKLALYWRMGELGLNNAKLARRLGVRETIIRRMLDPDHATKTEKLQAVVELLGQKIVLAVEDAA
jgi:antitoxin HicB